MTKAILKLLETAREIAPIGYDVQARSGYAEATKEHWSHIVIRHRGFELIAQIGGAGTVLVGPKRVEGKRIESLLEVVTAWEGREKK